MFMSTRRERNRRNFTFHVDRLKTYYEELCLDMW